MNFWKCFKRRCGVIYVAEFITCWSLYLAMKSLQRYSKTGLGVKCGFKLFSKFIPFWKRRLPNRLLCCALCLLWPSVIFSHVFHGSSVPAQFPDFLSRLLVMVMYQLLPCLKISENLICYQAGEKLLSCDITIIASLHFVFRLQECATQFRRIKVFPYVFCAKICRAGTFFYQYLPTVHFTTEQHSLLLSDNSKLCISQLWLESAVKCRVLTCPKESSGQLRISNWCGIAGTPGKPPLTWSRAQQSWEISPLCVSQLSSNTS